MNPEERLAALVTGLESVGLNCLVMGGHAVRYYGLNRHTNDFDLTLAPDRPGRYAGGRTARGGSRTG